ncbi:MAG: hypothetical protein PVI92_01655 [Chromatiales bacterium]
MSEHPLKLWIITLFLLFNISSTNAAEESQTGLSIDFLRETSSGIFVGFTVTPGDCAGSFQNAHAHMSRSAPQFVETVIRLTSAEVLETPVTAYYADIGDCTDETSLLQLSNIEIQ